MRKFGVRMLVLAVLIAVLGCNLEEKYGELRAKYLERRETIRSLCSGGTLSPVLCDRLRAANEILVAADRLIQQGAASKDQLKTAYDQLEETVNLQKEALEGNTKPPPS